MNSASVHDGVSRVGVFFSSHPDLLVITDAAGAALDVNELARRTLPAELGAGASLADCVHAEDRDAFEAAWAGLTSATGAATSLRFRGTDGTYTSFVMSARRAEGQPWVYVQLSAPPPARGAERSGRDADVEQNARILRAMLEEMDISVWAVDTRGAYSFQEGKALSAMGLRPRQQLGESVFDIFDEPTSLPTRRALAGERVDLVIPLGDVIWETAIRPLRDEQGHIEGAFGISINVTEREKARAEVESKVALIERQQEVIRDLETPIIQVWDRVLTLPMIGMVDSRRASRVMENLLAAVTKGQARFAILDLTGVEIVDTATANHIIGMIRAIRLLGAEGIITGLRPNVAQTIVSLGLDLSSILTLASLRDGLSMAIRRMAGENLGTTASAGAGRPRKE
jgi:rsbT co-antagonist protein RsbR